MLKKIPRIAIIGGGASAAILLANMNLNAEVDVYDRAGRFARGVAYSTDRLCHLLNVPVSNMSALADDKEHFSRWACVRGYGPDDFVPRKLYGDYLEELFNKSGARSIIANVRSCRTVAGGYEIEKNFYDYAILATGNVRPLSPSIKEHPQNYFSDPWMLPDSLKKEKSVALVGSGLTAVDAILSLLDIGFSGSITIFSKHGLLPMAHAGTQAWQLKNVAAGMAPSQILKFIRANITEALNAGVSWQSVIDSLRPVTNEIWQGWNDRERSSFLRHLYTIWGVHRHRMAPAVADRIKDADITFVRGRVDQISGNSISGMTFDAIINCMGYRYDEPEKNFEVSHVIGPARFGELFETTAIPEIRQQALKIIKNIQLLKPQIIGSNK
jgi:uncharacterized NAD(P)/FAD-binding protein YdhS